MDATESFLRTMVDEIERSDINVRLCFQDVLLPGSGDRSWEDCRYRKPVLCVTYEESDGLLEDIRAHFPDDIQRISVYRNLGERTRVRSSHKAGDLYQVLGD